MLITTLPEAMARAVAHFDANEFSECELLCRRVLEAEPTHGQALYLFGRMARRIGREDVAVAVLNQAIRATPNAIEVYRQLAEALRAVGEHGEAKRVDWHANALADPERVPGSACRLCGGETRFRLFKTLLKRHIVSYGVCQSCGSMQSETPYWLDEAYSIKTIGEDTGMCQRTLQIVIEVTALLQLLEVDREQSYIDFGGGNGLFTRMMRDRGFNFLSYDKYQEPFYSDIFVVDDFCQENPAVVTAFEVFEHFVNPSEEIKIIMSGDPDIVIFTTETYVGQGDDWPYFAESGGQHIFFYSNDALAAVGEQYGMTYFDAGLLKIYVSKKYLETPRPSGLSVKSILNFVMDREKFIMVAMEKFSEFQMNWQDRWVRTINERRIKSM